MNTKIFSILSIIPALTVLMAPLPAQSQFNDPEVKLVNYQYSQ
jgi:hypothetical protein